MVLGKVGLKIVLRPPRTEEAAVIVLEGGGLLVELLERKDAMPLSRAASGVAAGYQIHGIFKAGVIVDDFDRALELLKQRGVTIALGPFPARADQKANFLIRDNAGNLIQFFAR